jgi:hypothetical protein
MYFESLYTFDTWTQALKLAKTLAPDQLSTICRE